MARKGDRGTNGGSIVIRKQEIVEGGHHGGAWKVAYADFVTAMMAFFLLMWLINATTEAQRVGLADYFSQANVLNRGASGEGQPFGGHTPFDQGSLASDRGAITPLPGHNPVSPHVPRVPQGRQLRPVNPTPGGMLLPQMGGADPQAQNQAAASQAAATPPLETAAFDAAAAAMRKAITQDPALDSLSGQIRIDVTPNGLSIQIIDSHDRPMFDIGAAAPNDATTALLRKMAPVLSKLGHRLSIAGYTDARPYAAGSVSNWDLSVERANATRAVLVAAGLPETLVGQVSGFADRDLLMPEDPLNAGNRRIAILIARNPPAAAPATGLGKGP
jgi:chemotaxis protein MotB